MSKRWENNYIYIWENKQLADGNKGHMLKIISYSLCYFKYSPPIFNTYLSDCQCKSKHIYLYVCPIELNGVYFLEKSLELLPSATTGGLFCGSESGQFE